MKGGRGMRGGASAGLAMGVGLGLAASCGPSSFTCDGDEACAGLPDAQCEPSGYCSVPAPDCPGSGRRYAPHSGERSGLCVEALEGSSTVGSSTTGHDTTGSTGSSSSTSATSATSEDTGGNTTLRLDDDGTSGSPSDSSTSGMESTGIEPPARMCAGAVLVDEPFDALPLDADTWSTYDNPGIGLQVVGGELQVVATDATNVYAGAYTVLPLPPVGTAGVELTGVPAPDLPASGYFAISDSATDYGFSMIGDMLETYSDGARHTTRVILPYDPMAHRWLRLRFDAAGNALVWEVSADTVVWDFVDEELVLPGGFAFDAATIGLGAGTWTGPLSADPLGAFGHAFVCDG